MRDYDRRKGAEDYNKLQIAYLKDLFEGCPRFVITGGEIKALVLPKKMEVGIPDYQVYRGESTLFESSILHPLISTLMRTFS